MEFVPGHVLYGVSNDIDEKTASPYPQPSGMWLRFALRKCSDPLKMASLAGTTYTKTVPILYCFLDISLTEFLPGPLGFKTVEKSARAMKFAEEAKVRFSLAAVSAST